MMDFWFCLWENGFKGKLTHPCANKAVEKNFKKAQYLFLFFF